MSSKTKTSDATSRKRANAADNTKKAPTAKRQTQKASASSELKYVYIVLVNAHPPYGEDFSDIQDVYTTISDANNRLKALVNDEYAEPEDCEHSYDSDGCLSWSSNDVGEGERVEVKVQKFKVKQPGSEPECEWEDGVGGVSENDWFRR